MLPPEKFTFTESINMTRPLIQILNVATGEEIIREMTDAEIAELPAPETPAAEPTKEELMAELQALTAKIQALQ